ncbi:hypothetical protein D3C76_1028060 [compost metagenome]
MAAVTVSAVNSKTIGRWLQMLPISSFTSATSCRGVSIVFTGIFIARSESLDRRSKSVSGKLSSSRLKNLHLVKFFLIFLHLLPNSKGEKRSQLRAQGGSKTDSTRAILRFGAVESACFIHPSICRQSRHTVHSIPWV